MALTRGESVAALLESDGWEWVGWVAFAALEPFGPLRDDLRAGHVAAAAASAWGARVKPQDFFPTLRDSQGNDLKAACLALCPAMTMMG